MHKGDFDLNIDEVSKIEGKASLDLKIRSGKVVDLKFKITEFKRFYTQAIQGRKIQSIPQMVARICGTCSNAHLLCSIEALEKALGIKPPPQTMLLRKLTIYGLMIRDHALHLYFFSLPDLLGKSSIFDFDEKDVFEHKLLDDAFAIKSAGNKLSVWAAGRAVHAPNPAIGGFLKIPSENEIPSLIKTLENIRPKVINLIKFLKNSPFSLKEDFDFVGLLNHDFSFLEGEILTSQNKVIKEKDFGKHLDHVVIPYSQASGYRFKGKVYLVGALARLNLFSKNLHPKTQKSAKEALSLFPSKNIFHNNLAQAVEILHCIDNSIELLESVSLREEKLPFFKPREATGVGVIEAPRGTLYYKLEITEKGKVKRGDIVVPTGQNQIAIEKSILKLVQKNLNLDKKRLTFEIEKIIRIFDPCMSCAAHFLKVNWL